MTITLNPRVLRWARTRAGLAADELAKKIGTKPERVEQWEESGELRYSQAEKLAHKTYTPLGFLFLDSPPEERLPIQDFRTVANAPIRRPSPELLDTIQAMQQRQNWTREFLISEGDTPLSFVGSKTTSASPNEVANDIREKLGLAQDWARSLTSWNDALVGLRHKIEDAGVLIVINGVVGNNNYRKLKTTEFRGFALVDEYAPLIFINGTDGKAAQMFTFVHELAHVWVGSDGVSSLPKLQSPNIAVEKFCDSVAAEFLVPAAELRTSWRTAQGQENPYKYLASQFKVSPLVAARRAQDLGYISSNAFSQFWNNYEASEQRNQNDDGGGNFWNTQNVRIGPRFGAYVVRAAKEGKITYREAYHLTGLQGNTFDTYAVNLGFSA